MNKATTYNSPSVAVIGCRLVLLGIPGLSGLAGGFREQEAAGSNSAAYHSRFMCFFDRLDTGGFIFTHFIQMTIAEVYEEVKAYRQQIQDINDQYKNFGFFDQNDFRRDPRDVSKQNQADKRQAHALGRSGFIAFDRIDRPRKTEADQHNGFQYLRQHNFFLQTKF